MDAELGQRLARLLHAARQLRQAGSFGVEARKRLVASSGLSPAGVALALERSLECEPSSNELEALSQSVAPAPRVHVLLSAGVFVAAHRAIALALCASPHVSVRASRRDPAMLAILSVAAPGLFAVTQQLAPVPGEHVFAFGSASTLHELRRSLPRGVVLHAHGPGAGVVVVHSSELESDAQRDELAEQLALDSALFDQRGCLSPRLVLVSGDPGAAPSWAAALARALAELESTLPPGKLAAAELADITRYRSSLAYAGQLLRAGRGFVGLAPNAAPLELAPVGRNLHVVAVDDPAAALRPLSAHITTYAAAGPASMLQALASALPLARAAPFGRMQSPPLDGPVDRRTSKAGETLR
jgi:hypothetical protein